MVEVKGGDKLNNPNDIAKNNKAVIFCEVASNWSKANGRTVEIHIHSIKRN